MRAFGVAWCRSPHLVLRVAHLGLGVARRRHHVRCARKRRPASDRRRRTHRADAAGSEGQEARGISSGACACPVPLVWNLTNETSARAHPHSAGKQQVNSLARRPARRASALAVLRNRRLLQLVEDAAAAALGRLGRRSRRRPGAASVAGAPPVGAPPSKIERLGVPCWATSVNRMLVAKNAAASPAVVRVNRLAVPRPVRKPPPPPPPMPSAPPSERCSSTTAYQRRGNHQMQNEKCGRHGNLLKL